jgi:hypothetical protein
MIFFDKYILYQIYDIEIALHPLNGSAAELSIAQMPDSGL